MFGAGCRGAIIFWEILGEFVGFPAMCFGHWVVGEVSPFVGIAGVVVELFASIRVLNVAPVFGSDAVVPGAMGGDGGLSAFFGWVFQLRDE